MEMFTVRVSCVENDEISRMTFSGSPRFHVKYVFASVSVNLHK